MMHKVVAMPLEIGDRAQPMEHTVDSRNLHSAARNLIRPFIFLGRQDKPFRHFLFSSCPIGQKGSHFDLLRKHWKTLIISMYTNNVVEIHPDIYC